MPIVSAEKLVEIAENLLIAAGASEEESKVIARYNIGDNLVAHDSHRIILLTTYIDRITQSRKRKPRTSPPPRCSGKATLAASPAIRWSPPARA